MRKRQNEMTSSSKNGEYLILGRNSDFREKFGILELEMSHPGCNVIFMANKDRLDPAFMLHFFQIINKPACCHSQGPGQGPCPGSDESSSQSADPGFLSESIQSVICVPSCLQILPKTTLPSIPFLLDN